MTPVQFHFLLAERSTVSTTPPVHVLGVFPPQLRGRLAHRQRALQHPQRQEDNDPDRGRGSGIVVRIAGIRGLRQDSGTGCFILS